MFVKFLPSCLHNGAKPAQVYDEFNVPPMTYFFLIQLEMLFLTFYIKRYAKTHKSKDAKKFICLYICQKDACSSKAMV